MAKRAAHEARLARVRILDWFQFTNAEIAEVLRVSDATAQADRRLLSERHTPIHLTAASRYQFFLVIYAELVCKGTLSSSPGLTGDDRTLLRCALEYVLQVPEILAHLKGVEATVISPLILESETVPYYNLFCAAVKNDPRLMPEKPQTVEDFFAESLALIYWGLFTVPNSFSEHVTDLNHIYMERTRHLIRPQWSSQVQRMFREKMDQFLQASFTDGQRDVLRRHFGFGSRAPQTYGEIGRDRDISEQRVRELVRAGLGKVRDYCTIVEKDWPAPFLMSAGETLEASLRLIEARRIDEAAFRGQLVSIEALGDQGLTAGQIAFLAKSPAATEGVPMRLRNLVSEMGTWRDVVRKSDQEFLGMVFWGKKMLDQLHAALEREGLHTGMSV